MTFYAGIDLGGTKIAAGILDAAAGALVAQRTIPTHAAEGPEAVIQRMAGLVRDLTAETGAQVIRVGLGAPAVIDYEGGRTLLMPNLPGDWYGRPVAAQLSDALDLPVTLINDARAFTLAEAALGAGRGASTVACFTVGTGVGGGIALEGRLHMGLKGAAGELGHQTIDPAGPMCNCGNRGCLEALASGTAIIASAVEAAQAHPESALNTLTHGDLSRITPLIVMHAAQTGDAAACAVLERAGTYLGIGVANVLTMLSADCVVIGGGVSQLGDLLLNPVRQTVAARCYTVDLQAVRIVPAQLGQAAGIIGAALWASQR